MTNLDRPKVRLMPNADASKIRHGFPWVYNNELVLDRRTKNIAAGTICTLESADRTPLATIAFNPNSRIAVRVLDMDVDAEINEDWFVAKLSNAQALRETLFDAPYYRLVHAEADRIPGVVIDRYGDVAVVQPNAAWADHLKTDLTNALVKVTGVTGVVLNGSGRARSQEGLEDTREVLFGDVPETPITVPMNGATYLADLMGGQKTGLFFDQRDNHAFAAKFAKDARVLDVFCHVGGFGAAALAAGAQSVTFVDGSAPALEFVDQSAKAMDVADKVTTVKADAFEYLTQAIEAGEKFDVVICDPPAFAPAKSALGNGLRAYEKVARLSAQLVAPGGVLVLCSCSHAATVDKFASSSIRGIGRAGRVAQMVRTGFASADHPQHPMLSENSYLKALTFRMVG